MCDSFVAQPSTMTTRTTLTVKNADCEINEAPAVLRLPRRSYSDQTSKHTSWEGH